MLTGSPLVIREGRSHHDRLYPGIGRFGLFELMNVVEDFNKGFLKNVFGFGSCFGVSDTDTHQSLLVAFIEEMLCLGFMLLAANDQLSQVFVGFLPK